jgi:general secretion pathway protein A
MYETHYGFTEKPFNLTPDPKYLYLSPRHTEAFAHLEFGRRERGGFIVITGEVGTGKTTLARYFLSHLDARTATAFVLYPALSGAELLRSILDDLHVPAAGTSMKDSVDALHRFLLHARTENRDVVLLIDEAQDLSTEVLEQVRLISNLETDTEKLITIILMGQSELNEMLSRRELRQLAQRITARYHLAPLDELGAADYIRHRLEVAGGAGKVGFTRPALSAVHRFSGGIPRLINLICDRALLAGYVKGARTIESGMVRRAAEEVQAPPASPAWRRPLALAGAAGCLAAAVAFLIPRTLPARESPVTASAVAPASVAATAPATASAAAPATARASSPALEPVVLSLRHDASLAGAVREIQAVWGQEQLERTALRTHLDQVRRLDMPAVLEMFHPTRRDTCYLALLRLEGDQAVVAGADGATLRVPVSEVDRWWTRQAIFLWRDFDLTQRDPDRTAAWAREALGRLGYLGQDTDLPAAVARFQRDAQLTADGVLGNRTVMSLYTRGPYPRPRHSGGTS